MNRIIRSLSLGGIAVALIFSRSSAQGRGGRGPTPAELRDMIVEDSLTPAKKQLRDYVAELRDTLVKVPAIYASINRNRSNGVASVVLSNGRELGKRCRVSTAMTEVTAKRIEPLYTNDPKGDQALNAYRAGLTSLLDDLRTCVHDDSVTMAAKTPDQKRIEDVAAAARDAISRYDAIRDGLMKLLDITLPVKGTIGRARH